MNIKQRLKLLLQASFFSLFVVINAFSPSQIKAQTETSFCRQDLPKTIDNIINQPELKKANWGIIVKNGDNDETFYQLNSDKYFLPASNAKLLITASSLIKFGKNYQVTTPVYIRGSAPVLDTLIIMGSSDPTLTHNSLKNIAQKLKKDGIKSINKVIVVGDNQTDNLVNGTWEVSDLPFAYAPPISKLNLVENVVSFNVISRENNQLPIINWSDNLGGKQWRVNNQILVNNNIKDSQIKLTVNWQNYQINLTGEMPPNSESRDWRLTIPNPSQYFLDSLVNILQTNNILVNTSQVNDSYNLSDYQLYQEIKSPILKEIIATTNKDSNNLYAEFLYDNLANNQDSKIESLTKILTDLGLENGSFFLNDGSGLSRQNLVTPSALHTVLKLMQNEPSFVNSLSIAGIDGTLSNRFKDTIVEGKLRGKTGTLTGAVALAGYLDGENFDNLIVTIIVNNSNQSVSILRENIDKIILHLAKLKDC
ncbi:MAG: D-alanyl-D-alanine carboxypeptidase/D-alanyl-D-alanine-endopeptidase [Cyanobacterium sp. T60_A2020_053]|nr:D-alanyl-D-alanine carboxypeptidase/D-alanyl-D-alanine-endopeptidase [Cyanobacterium sp. T60_A2020_053]